jgi:Bacterial membrane protein YfhO
MTQVNNMLLKKVLPHIVAVLIFTVLSCIFFYPQLEGKKFPQHDITSFRGMSNELEQYQKDTGNRALWTNSMFSGMPAYQITTGRDLNPLQYLEKIGQLFIQRPIGYFIGAMIGFYILFIVLGVNPWLSIVGAVAFGFATNSMVLFDAGHTSKLRTIFSAAPLIAGVLLTYRRRYLLGGTLFATALAVNLYTNHYQMTYYLLILIGVYGLFELVNAVRTKGYQNFVKASVILLVGAGLAVASSGSKVFATLEYAQDTMRGTPILENNKARAGSSSETNGLAWEYAMNWSNGPIDLLGMMIPRAAGGSAMETVGEESNLFQDFTTRGIRLSGDFVVPLYYGDLPSTSGPSYLGAVLIFLFILGLFLVEGRLKWWILFAVIFTILMSMGKHFAVFNRILFDYLPYFNKFRAPSSILTMTSIFVPILATLGVAEALKTRVDAKKLKTGLIVALSTTVGVSLLLVVAGGTLIDFSGSNDSYYESIGYSVEILKADRLKYLRADAFRSIVLIILSAAALWGYHKGKIKPTLLIGMIGLLVLVDLWGIDKRYISSEDFIPASRMSNMYAMTDIDKEILSDPDLHFRVHDLTVDPWNSAARSYYLKTIGGYHAAKLQRYQDIMDYYLYDGKQSVLNMLNAKYFIVNNDKGVAQAQRNMQAQGNAWFVEGILRVKTADEEIEALANIDLRAMAVVHEEFEEYIAGFDPSRNGTIKLTSYAPDRLTYESNSQSDQLAVFSEVWYGPDKGWEAYIDGQPAQIIRANYILRAMNVPAGRHSIEMVFRPKNFYRGEAISMITSFLIVLGFIGALVWRAREARLLEQVPDEKPTPRVKKTKAKRKRK